MNEVIQQQHSAYLRHSVQARSSIVSMRPRMLSPLVSHRNRLPSIATTASALQQDTIVAAFRDGRCECASTARRDHERQQTVRDESKPP
jgi:hypothetical protein